jgi:hypothetical protein
VNPVGLGGGLLSDSHLERLAAFKYNVPAFARLKDRNAALLDHWMKQLCGNQFFDPDSF